MNILFFQTNLLERHLIYSACMKQKGKHTREPQHAKPKTKLQVLLAGSVALVLRAIRWLANALLGGLALDLIKLLIGL